MTDGEGRPPNTSIRSARALSFPSTSTLGIEIRTMSSQTFFFQQTFNYNYNDMWSLAG